MLTKCVSDGLASRRTTGTGTIRPRDRPCKNRQQNLAPSFESDPEEDSESKPTSKVNHEHSLVVPQFVTQRVHSSHGQEGRMHGEARREDAAKRGACMARHVKKTRPQGTHRKAAGDESRRTIQCTPTTPHIRTARSLAACSPALIPAQKSNGIFACAACRSACRSAHAPCSARPHLACPLP